MDSNVYTSTKDTSNLLRQVAEDLESLALSDDTGYLRARAGQCRRFAEMLDLTDRSKAA